MKKNKIRMNEAQLRNIIKSSVNRILRENEEDGIPSMEDYGGIDDYGDAPDWQEQMDDIDDAYKFNDPKHYDDPNSEYYGHIANKSQYNPYGGMEALRMRDGEDFINTLYPDGMTDDEIMDWTNGKNNVGDQTTWDSKESYDEYNGDPRGHGAQVYLNKAGKDRNKCSWRYYNLNESIVENCVKNAMKKIKKAYNDYMSDGGEDETRMKNNPNQNASWLKNSKKK